VQTTLSEPLANEVVRVPATDDDRAEYEALEK